MLQKLILVVSFSFLTSLALFSCKSSSFSSAFENVKGSNDKIKQDESPQLLPAKDDRASEDSGGLPGYNIICSPDTSQWDQEKKLLLACNLVGVDQNITPDPASQWSVAPVSGFNSLISKPDSPIIDANITFSSDGTSEDGANILKSTVSVRIAEQGQLTDLIISRTIRETVFPRSLCEITLQGCEQGQVEPESQEDTPTITNALPIDDQIYDREVQIRTRNNQCLQADPYRNLNVVANRVDPLALDDCSATNSSFQLTQFQGNVIVYGPDKQTCFDAYNYALDGYFFNYVCFTVSNNGIFAAQRIESETFTLLKKSDTTFSLQLVRKLRSWPTRRCLGISQTGGAIIVECDVAEEFSLTAFTQE